MYNNIKDLRPYFFSLREIDNNVSLDIRIPTSWKYDTIILSNSSIKTKVQDKNEKYNLLSLISSANQDGYNLVFGCANEIITTNREDEEKMKLFKEKVEELQNIFMKTSLDKLKEISFINNGEIDSTGIGTVGEVQEEGSDID